MSSTLLVLAPDGDPYIEMLGELRGRAEVVVASSAAALDHAAERADALFVWGSFRAEAEALLNHAPNLRWIHLRWAGLDSFLFPALVESDVVLTNSRGVYSQSLGEFASAGALFFAKDLRRLLGSQREHKWDPFVMQELRGATMGIVGYGDIGRACAQRAHALGMRVVAFRKRPEQSSNDGILERTFGPGELHEMLCSCDYVVACAPLTPETRGLIGAAEIEAMKPTAVLMNVGRGPVIDEAALIEALRSRRIRGAALDVFTEEPLKPDSPLWAFDNVLLSPHCADNTPTWNEDAIRFFLANFDRFSRGEALENVVDKRAGY